LLPRRLTRSDGPSSFTDSERHLILAAETLRAGESVPIKVQREEKPEERISLFWRLFGGTLLSICALAVLNAYQSLNNNIHEVRADLGRLRDSNGELIRKDDFNARQQSLWTSIRDLQTLQTAVTVQNNKLGLLEQQTGTAERDHKEIMTLSAALTAMREKDALLEKVVKDAEAERKELCRELQQLRERLAKLEGQAEKKASP
jgi:DNA repair exonuclease SbcCD ATPase subunit